MNSTKQKDSKLANFEIYYEHTDDNRVLLNKKLKPLKKPRRSTASRR